MSDTVATQCFFLMAGLALAADDLAPAAAGRPLEALDEKVVEIPLACQSWRSCPVMALKRAPGTGLALDEGAAPTSVAPLCPHRPPPSYIAKIHASKLVSRTSKMCCHPNTAMLEVPSLLLEASQN